MTLSEDMESQIDDEIDRYGATVTIQKQTADYESTYDEATPEWADSTTVSTKALVNSPRRAVGEEWHYGAAGVIQENEYFAVFKATETLESSGFASATATRYIIVYNAQNYEIIELKPHELQDNVYMKTCILRLIT